MQSRNFRSRRRANAPTFSFHEDHPQDDVDSGPSRATLGFQSPRLEDFESRESRQIKHSPTVTKNLSDYFLDPSPQSSSLHKRCTKHFETRPAARFGFASASSSSEDDQQQHGDETDESVVNSDSDCSSQRGHHRSASEQDPRITQLFRSIPWGLIEGNRIHTSNQAGAKETADFNTKLASVVLEQRSPAEAIRAWQSSGPFPPADEASSQHKDSHQH